MGWIQFPYGKIFVLIYPYLLTQDIILCKKKVFLTQETHFSHVLELINPLSARIFTISGLLEDRVLHKEALVAKLLGTHLSI